MNKHDIIQFGRYVTGYQASIINELYNEWVNYKDRKIELSNDVKIYTDFAANGIVYSSRKERRGCQGCCFYRDGCCQQLEITNVIRRCSAESRVDNQGIIFEVKVKKPI